MRSTRRVVGAFGALVLVGLTACAPRFPTGAQLTFDQRAAGSPGGPGVTVSWPDALELDDGQTVVGYEVAVNGDPVTTGVPTRACNLVGLPVGTFTVTVTAYDSAGESSRDAGPDGTLSAPVHVDNPPLPGTPVRCQTGPTPPGTPTGVTATALGGGQAAVSWTAPSYLGTTHQTLLYKVIPVRGAVVEPEQWSATTTLTVTSLKPGSAYTFIVQAVTEVGEGPRSVASAPVAIP